MPACCSVLGCGKKVTLRKSNNISFHTFPSDSKICYDWIIRCGNTNLLGKSPRYLTTHNFVCSDHFPKTAFHQTEKGRWFLDKKTYVPSLNLPTPLSSETLEKSATIQTVVPISGGNSSNNEPPDKFLTLFGTKLNDKCANINKQSFFVVNTYRKSSNNKEPEIGILSNDFKNKIPAIQKAISQKIVSTDIPEEENVAEIADETYFDTEPNSPANINNETSEIIPYLPVVDTNEQLEVFDSEEDIDFDEFEDNDLPLELADTDTPVILKQFDFQQLCRICAQQNEHMQAIFKNNKEEMQDSEDLAHKIKRYLYTDVKVDDKLPVRVCTSCIVKLEDCHSLAVACGNSQNQLGKMLKELEAENQQEETVEEQETEPQLEEVHEVESPVHSPVGDCDFQQNDEEMNNETNQDEDEEKGEHEASEPFSLSPMPPENDNLPIKFYICEICTEMCSDHEKLEMHYYELHKKLLCAFCTNIYYDKLEELYKHTYNSHAKEIEELRKQKSEARKRKAEEAAKNSPIPIIPKPKKQKVINAELDEILKSKGLFVKSKFNPNNRENRVKRNYKTRQPKVNEKGPPSEVENSSTNIKDIPKENTNQSINVESTSELLKESINKKFEAMKSKIEKQHNKTTPPMTLNTKTEKQYECIICTFKFQDIHKFVSHILDVHKDYENPDLKLPTDVLDYFIKLDVKCRKCGEVFKLHKDLLLHKKQQHIELHKCEHCHFNHKTKSVLEFHMIKFHLNHWKYQCKYCKISDSCKIKIQEHIKKHKRSKKYKLHYTRISDYYCNVCKKYLKNEYIIESHNKKHEKEKKDPNYNNYLCYICAKLFRTESTLNEHIKYHPKIYQCEMCSESYNHPRKLKAHVNKVHSIRRDKCLECNAEFKSSNNLKRHRESVHKEGKVYNCAHCERFFYVKFLLQQHLETHINCKPIICKYCNKKFKTSKTIHKHINTVHNPDRKKYNCNYCSKIYLKRKPYIEHSKTHTGGILEVYKCDSCNKNFITKEELKLHHDSEHLNIYSHACKYCDKVFKSKGYFNNHLLLHTTYDKMIKKDTPMEILSVDRVIESNSTNTITENRIIFEDAQCTVINETDIAVSHLNQIEMVNNSDVQIIFIN